MDLAGNVWEWTATIYAPDAYKIDADNPQDREDLDGTGYRVVRGGGWAAKREWVRCAYRHRNDPGGGDFNLGFRLARTLS
jgi:formylglycine-generating enzyme required for sulfatase activity